MPRIYDVDSGSVRMAGEDIRNIRLSSLRREVCYLSQDPVLFDGTLESNLRFVRPAVSDDTLHEVIRCVGLADFLAILPEGLRQSVGPGGCQLSGGQRQRLAIARALLQRPQVLILDEATSCLDPASEVFVLQNLRRYLRNLTLIAVMHRFSTVVAFDRIVVLSGGRIVQDRSVDESVGRTQRLLETPCQLARNPDADPTRPLL
jgi:ATP-binding cassette subfamily B protein